MDGNNNPGTRNVVYPAELEPVRETSVKQEKSTAQTVCETVIELAGLVFIAWLIYMIWFR